MVWQLRVVNVSASFTIKSHPFDLHVLAMVCRFRLVYLVALTITEPPALAIVCKFKVVFIEINNKLVNHFAVACPSRIGLVSKAEQIPRWLASRGEGVVGMRITFSYSTISTMYEKFGMLISGNLTRCVNRFRLSVKKSSESCVSLSSNSPFTIGRDYVLVLSHSKTPPSCARIKVKKT